MLGAVVGLMLAVIGGISTLVGMPDGVQVAAIGAGLYSVSAGAKTAQKFAEGKPQPATKGVARPLD